MAVVWHLLDPNEGSFSKHRTIAGLYEIPILIKEDLITRFRCWIHRLGSAQDWKTLSSSVKLLISLPNVLRIEQAQWRFYWIELPTWRKPCNLTCLKQLVSEPHFSFLKLSTQLTLNRLPFFISQITQRSCFASLNPILYSGTQWFHKGYCCYWSSKLMNFRSWQLGRKMTKPRKAWLTDWIFKWGTVTGTCLNSNFFNWQPL